MQDQINRSMSVGKKHTKGTYYEQARNMTLKDHQRENVFSRNTNVALIAPTIQVFKENYSTLDSN